MTHILSADLGFGNMKAYSALGGTVMASHAAFSRGSARFDGVYDESEPDEVQLIEFGDASMYVGLGAHRYGRATGDLDTGRITRGSMEMRSLLYGVLSKHLGKPGKLRKPFTLYVQLPVELMQASNAQETRERVSGWLLGDHEWISWDQKFKVTIEDVRVLSQAAGAVYDHLMDEDGDMVSEHVSDMAGNVGVISIGYNTLEIMALEDGKQNHAMTAGDKLGVSHLFNMIDGGKRGVHRIDVMLRAGLLNGTLDAPLDEWSDLVRANIASHWRDYVRSLSCVFIVGGGGMLIGEQVASMFNCRVIVPGEPILSIVRGGYKRGMFDVKNGETAKAG